MLLPLDVALLLPKLLLPLLLLVLLSFLVPQTTSQYEVDDKEFADVSKVIFFVFRGRWKISILSIEAACL